MEYLIRRAVKGDESILAYIQTESWKVAFRGILSDEELEKCTEILRATKMYQKLLDNNIGNVYILEVNGKPHCIAYWDRARDTELSDYAELICIHSLPDNWRQGFGTKMIEQVIGDVRNAGYKKIMLWVFKDNIRARRFYESNGFVTFEKKKENMIPIEIMYEKNL